MSQATRQNGYAARRREMEKIDKYSNEHLPGGASPNFSPLVFEHFGCLGQAAEQFQDSLAKFSRDIKGNRNVAELKKTSGQDTYLSQYKSFMLLSS